ncbi:hypothetical protein PIB30_019111 [Stylosanthes scabra]|uniref:Uncharacterized protein n=1 Tax=Stylosanthes scabra TaxID=79078 RepID=A0ABU6VAB7_9FABA|nr:hypothetical protein [Stylosanthes scabra]
MARRYSEIVVRVYPNGTSREGLDGVEFHYPNQVVFMMWLLKTLSDLQKTVLSNMRLPKQTPIIRMAYRFLVVMSDISCRYRMFWFNNDEHTATPRAGLSEPAPKVNAPTATDPIDVVPPLKHTGEIESGEEDCSDTKGSSSGSGENEFVSATHSLFVTGPIPGSRPFYR